MCNREEVERILCECAYVCVGGGTGRAGSCVCVYMLRCECVWEWVGVGTVWCGIVKACV